MILNLILKVSFNIFNIFYKFILYYLKTLEINSLNLLIDQVYSILLHELIQNKIQ